ncbi:MAG: glycosyltransferase family 4 protein [Chitinophagaceae bacterium]
MKTSILFILHLPPPVHGAALMGAYVKSSKEVRDNFDCHFINLSASKSIGSIGKLGMKKVLFFFQLLLSTTKALLKKNYDVCYVTITSHGTAFYKDLFVVTILKIFRKKILLHFHNKGIIEGSAANNINNYLYKFVLGGKKTRVVLLSPFLYYDIKKYVEPSRVYYCANGIPAPGMPDDVSEKKLAGPVRILFLSNMMMAKGVFVLLDACVLLSKSNISFECHFVGDWLDISETTFDQKVKELHLSGKIFAYGKKYGQEKNAFYQQSDIFVFPSLDEAFPLVLLEAMQFKLPIVASDVGGVQEIVIDKQTGFVVQRNDAEALACKLLSLIKDASLRNSMGISGKKRFEDNFTLEKFEARFLTILKDAAHAA